MFSGETAQESTSAEVRTAVEQNTDYQVAENAAAQDTAADNATDMDSTESNESNLWEQFSSNENGETADVLEQSFLSGLQGDTESDIIQRGNSAETTDTAKTAQTQSVATASSADPGMEAAVQQYVAAVEMFGGKTDRKIQSPALLSAKDDPTARRAVEAMIDRTSGEYQQNSHPEMVTAQSAVETDGTYPAENQVEGRSKLDSEREAKNQSSSGIVEIKAPPNATPDQIAQVQAYIDGCNEALKAERLSKSGRVSTKGALRRKASKAARNEAKRAQDAGTPYIGHVGHVPDTTWTGTAEPYRWQDLDPVVNTSLGGQTKRYPIGFKPTGFVFKEDE